LSDCFSLLIFFYLIASHCCFLLFDCSPPFGFFFWLIALHVDFSDWLNFSLLILLIGYFSPDWFFSSLWIGSSIRLFPSVLVWLFSLLLSIELDLFDLV
jgi:hypothetical protein